MYVCLCNGITDRDVETAVVNGASRAAHVYKKHDCKAKCGKCTNQIRDMLAKSTNVSS